MSVLMPNRAAGRRARAARFAAARAAAPYEMRFSRTVAGGWEPASHREVREWLGGWTYTAASAMLALGCGEEVETDWCRIRRRKEATHA